jgi:hypothetical protein
MWLECRHRSAVTPAVEKLMLCRTERLTALTVKSTSFWDVTPCSLVEVYRRFREPYCLHILEGLRLNQLYCSSFCLLPTRYRPGLHFDPEDGGSVVLRNVGELITRPHGITSQAIVLLEVMVSRNFALFMEPEYSLPCSLEPVTGPHPEPQ